jgi:N-acetylmuramoyl-L-alanine amidase
MNWPGRAPFTRKRRRRRPQAYRTNSLHDLRGIGHAAVVGVIWLAASTGWVELRGASAAGAETTESPVPTVAVSSTPTGETPFDQMGTVTPAPARVIRASTPTSWPALTVMPTSVVGPTRLNGLMPEACHVYPPPLANNRHLTVFIDPGHGGLDSGAVGTPSSGSRLLEKDLTLALGLRLVQPLRTAGFTVVLSRTADSTVGQPEPANSKGGAFTGRGSRIEVQARIMCANATGADLLLSVHMNAFVDPRVAGAETLFDSVRPFSAQSNRLARLVQQNLLDSFTSAGWSVPNRGIISDAQLGVTTSADQTSRYRHLVELGPAQPGYVDEPSQMPGALVEPLFITNPVEAEIARSEKGQAAMSRGLLQAVKDFFPDSAAPSQR